MKRTIFAVMSALLLVVCTGCANSNDESSGTASFMTDSSGNTLITDKVVGTYSEVQTAKKICDIYNSSIKTIDPEILETVFFADRDQSVEKTVNQNNGTIKFDAGIYHGYSTALGFALYTDNGTKFDDEAAHFLFYPDEKYMDTSTEFSFASREETLKSAMDFIDSIGLDPQKAVLLNMYSVKKEGFDAYKEYLDRIAVEEDDETAAIQAEAIANIDGEDFYYISLTFSEDEIPIYSGGPYVYGSDDHDVFIGTRFMLLYTKSGLEYVVSTYIYQKDDIIESAEIIDFSEAQTLLKNKFDNMFVDNDITFYNAELTYLPFPQNSLNEMFKRIIMRPYYAFYGMQNVELDGANYTSDFVVFFDAVTGKEL